MKHVLMSIPLIVILTPGIALAQDLTKSVFINVIDQSTLEGAENATVMVICDGRSTAHGQTNIQGKCRFDIPNPIGKCVVIAKFGYETAVTEIVLSDEHKSVVNIEVPKPMACYFGFYGHPVLHTIDKSFFGGYSSFSASALRNLMP